MPDVNQTDKPKLRPHAGQEMYPYCVTCKECGPSHSEGEAAVEEFLSRHPSPDHEVNPKWESEIPR